jgi:hypothetical protein
MSQENWLRIGGAAAILGVVLSLGALAAPVLLAIGSLAIGVFIFALYRWFGSYAPTLSLAAAVVGIVGAVVLAIISLPSGAPNNALSNVVTWAAWFLPPLVFGFLAYRNPATGMPRLLALIGIAGGILGLINLIVVLIGGGNWAEPNNPGLGPVIMISYYGGMLLTLVWLVWTGILMFRSKVAPQRQPA